MKAISLLSGGLDSQVATALARREFDIPLALTFDYGQRAAAREIEVARAICGRCSIEHRVIALPWLADSTRTALVDKRRELPQATPDSLDRDAQSRAAAVWVPNRNGIFIAIAAALAESMECETIVAGFNAEEAKTFPDNSSAFIDATNAALAFSTRSGVVIESPTLEMAKDEIARRFVELDLDPEQLWCCYEGGSKLCGTCESCARTIRAFKKIGAWDMICRRFAY